MTALVDRSMFGGHTLVYLPRYLTQDDAFWRASDEEVRETFLAALGRMYPGFEPQDVVAFQVARVREMMAVTTLNYSEEALPPLRTSLPNVFVVNSSQIANGTLNVNETVGLANASARQLEPMLRAPAGLGGRLMPRRRARSPASRSIWTTCGPISALEGDPAWESRPSYLPTFLPRVLDLLQRLELRITFFVVGYDATRESNRPHLRAIAERGHEVGNHSFWHECWLQRYSPEQLDEEIARAHEALHDGHRAAADGIPGAGVQLVASSSSRRWPKHGYAYDASTLPTFLGPLARLYFLASARLSPEQRAERAQLFGAARDGFRPNRPYELPLRSGGRLLEVPVTTVPVLRTPFHMSYLLYLSRYSPALMRAYLRFALAACHACRVEPSFLLHPLDLLGGDEVPHLAFFPGMDLTSAQKTQLVDEVLGALGERFDLVTVGEQARRILAGRPAARQWSSRHEPNHHPHPDGVTCRGLRRHS